MAREKGSKKKSNVLGIRFWYTGIRVKNLEESMKLYREVLGFQVLFKAKMTAHEGTYVQMRTPTGKQILELNYYPKTSKFYEEYANGSELDHIGLYVSDVRGPIWKVSELWMQTQSETIQSRIVGSCVRSRSKWYMARTHRSGKEEKTPRDWWLFVRS